MLAGGGQDDSEKAFEWWFAAVDGFEWVVLGSEVSRGWTGALHTGSHSLMKGPLWSFVRGKDGEAGEIYLWPPPASSRLGSPPPPPLHPRLGHSEEKIV